MKRIVISSKGEPERRRMSFGQRVMLAWTIVNLLLAFCVAIFSIVNKWGNSTVAFVWLILLCAYVAVFALVVLFSRKKSADVLHNRLNYSLAALKILTSLSNLLNLLMALFQVLSAFSHGDISGATTVATMVVLLLFTILGIILKVNGIIKRRKKQKQKQAKLAAKQKKRQQLQTKKQ